MATLQCPAAPGATRVPSRAGLGGGPRACAHRRPRSSGAAAVRDVPEPVHGPGDLLVAGPAVGIRGPDRERPAGGCGWAATGEEHPVPVLENDAVLGPVNADRDHHRAAADALARADRDRLARGW